MGSSSTVEAGHSGPQPSGMALNHNVHALQRSSLIRDGQTQSEDWTTICTHRKNKSKEGLRSPDSSIIIWVGLIVKMDLGISGFRIILHWPMRWFHNYFMGRKGPE